VHLVRCDVLARLSHFFGKRLLDFHICAIGQNTRAYPPQPRLLSAFIERVRSRRLTESAHAALAISAINIPLESPSLQRRPESGELFETDDVC
jgi:hypothetical protein